MGCTNARYQQEIVQIIKKPEENKEELAHEIEYELQSESYGLRTDYKGKSINIFDREERDSLFENTESLFELEYVTGFNSEFRHSLFYTSLPGKILYSASSIGVVQDKLSSTQRFFTGHRDMISAVCVMPNKEIIASAEIAENPQICIWSVRSPEAPPRQVLKVGHGRRGITALAFSSNGSFLAVADMHANHYISVWGLSNGSKIAEQKTTTNKVFQISWNSTNSFCTVGIRHIQFWSIEEGLLVTQKPEYKKLSSPFAMCCVCGLEGSGFVSGDSDGAVYVWRPPNIENKRVIHNGYTSVIQVSKDLILTGGIDGKIVFSTFELEQTRVLNLNEVPFALDIEEENLLVATKEGHILEVNEEIKVIVESHSEGELLGFTANSEYVITAGDDCKVRVWDFYSQKCIKTHFVKDTKFIRAIALMPQDEGVSIGLSQGQICVYPHFLNNDSKKITLEDPQDHAVVLKYSPTGKQLAAAIYSGALYVYETEGYTLQQHFMKNISNVVALDWSCDGNWIRCKNITGQVNVFGINKPHSNTVLTESEWESHTCLDLTELSAWGIFQDYAIASNKHGDVCVFKGYDDKELIHVIYGHCLYVSCAKWSPDGNTLFTLGGFDRILMKWQCAIFSE